MERNETRERGSGERWTGRDPQPGRGALGSSGLGAVKDVLVASLCFDLDQQ